MITHLLVWYKSIDVNIFNTSTDKSKKCKFKKARFFIEYPEKNNYIFSPCFNIHKVRVLDLVQLEDNLEVKYYF